MAQKDPRNRDNHFHYQLNRRCDLVMAEIHANPPHVLGWLQGGIDTKRMEELKKEIENRPAYQKKLILD